MEKKRYEIEIAGVDMAIISDEREDFVQRLARELDDAINAITKANKRCSKMDAAILCALDYASDKIKAEKRVRNLEAQVALYDANLRRMKEENARLKGETFVCAAPRNEVELVEEEAEAEVEIDAPAAEQAPADIEVEIIEETPGAHQMTIDDESAQDSREDKLRRVEEMLKSRGDSASRNEGRENKLRQIESLLKNRGN